MARSHVIESLQFDVAFDSADEAFAQQGRLGSFANGLALEVIERVFDDMAPAGRVWRLDRLDVRLPLLPASEPDSTWAERLETGLREALGQDAAPAAGLGERPAGRRLASAAGGQAVMATATASAPGRPDVESSRLLPGTPSGSSSGSQPGSDSAMSPELESLWYWLHHGHLPWHVDGRPTDAVRALWQGATPEQRQVLQHAVQHSPQRATLQQRWASQGLVERPGAEWVAGADAVRGAAGAQRAERSERDGAPAIAPQGSADSAPAHGYSADPTDPAAAERRAALRHHDPGPATWAVWMESLSASQRRQLCRQWVPVPQVGLVEALAESVTWRTATQALLPGLGEAQCRAALWGCAMGAALHLGDERFDTAHWVSLMLQRWAALVPPGKGWAALARELDTASSVAILPAAAWQALRDGVALLRHEAPLHLAAAGPEAGQPAPVSRAGLSSAEARTPASEAASALRERASHHDNAGPVASDIPRPAFAAKSASAAPVGGPGSASPREPGVASTAARREGPGPSPSAEALAAWQQVTRALAFRSDANGAEIPATTTRPAGPRAAARQRLEPALAAADLREVAATWAEAARVDRRWLAARLQHHGRRHAWRQALARSLDDAQFESLLRLWAGESDTRRLLGLLSMADRWSLGSLRQPPSWRGLLHEWLVDHLLVGPTAAFELRSCVAHLLQQRARWDGRPAHEVARALRGAAGEPAAPGLDVGVRAVAGVGVGVGAAVGVGVGVGIGMGVLPNRPYGEAVDELPLAVRHLIGAATRRIDGQAMSAAPAVAATVVVPTSPADAEPTRVAEAPPMGAARSVAVGASLDAMRARLDAALARVDPRSAGDEWLRGCREDRAWLAARLQHHGRSAAWRAAWAAHPGVPWSDLLGLWLSPAEVARVDAFVSPLSTGSETAQSDVEATAGDLGWPATASRPPQSVEAARRRRRVLDGLFAERASAAAAAVPPAAEVDADADADADADIVAGWPDLLSDAASMLLPPSAPSSPPLPLQHLAQRDRLAALLASPEAAARQVDLLDEAGRRQLLRCLRPDAAAPALAALDLLVQARAEASTDVALTTPAMATTAGATDSTSVTGALSSTSSISSTSAPTVISAAGATHATHATPQLANGRGRDDWRFVLRELVEEDRPFEPAGFARRWWAFIRAASAATTVAVPPSDTAPAVAGAPRSPSLEAVAEALGRQAAASPVGTVQGTAVDRAGAVAAGVARPSVASPPSSLTSPAARVALARRLQAGLAESARESDVVEGIEDAEGIEHVDRPDRLDDANRQPQTGEPVPDEAEAFFRPVAPFASQTSYTSYASYASCTPPWPDAPRAAEPPPWAAFASPAAPAPDTTMYVHNAGLVLLGPYLPMLFSRLGLTVDQAFKDEASAERALHLLQFLCDGSLQPGEHQLLLPKLLCGVNSALPVVHELVLGDDEQAACTSLLEAVIAHWRALGKTSVAGLRETFLQREGALTLLDDEWSLTVETKAFDILIDQLPWGFSTCRFPWMNKVLHVHWR